MKGHIARKRDRYYLVLDVGTDPMTGRRRQRWHSGPDRKGWTSKRDAERALRRMVTSREEGTYVDPSTITVREYLEAWLPTMRLRDSTMDIYRVQLSAYVLPRLGSIRLQELSADILETFYVELERAGGRKGRPLSAKTVRNVHVMLHRALARAEQRALIARNPAALAEKPKPRRRELHPWTADETGRFLNASEGDRLHAAFVVMAMAGLRRGEVLGLRWADLDLDRATISVRRALVLVGHAPTFHEPKTEAPGADPFRSPLRRSGRCAPTGASRPRSGSRSPMSTWIRISSSLKRMAPPPILIDCSTRSTGSRRLLASAPHAP